MRFAVGGGIWDILDVRMLLGRRRSRGNGRVIGAFVWEMIGRGGLWEDGGVYTGLNNGDVGTGGVALLVQKETRRRGR